MATAVTARPADLTTLPHSGLGVGEFYGMHFTAAMIPLTAGLLLFGWRAAMAIFLVGLGTMIGITIWRSIGSRGHALTYSHGLWRALLLALMLPAHLASAQFRDSNVTPWYLLFAAGLLLAAFLWLLGGLGSGRVHPVLVTYLFVIGATTGPVREYLNSSRDQSAELLTPHWVLQRNHLLVGDILRSSPQEKRFAEEQAWFTRPTIGGEDAENVVPASEPLSQYTRARQVPTVGWLPIQSLIRDDLPPLEDLIVGGHPSPIGTGSAIAVIMGGLFLLYRGLIDFRIPLLIILIDFTMLLLLPIPAALSHQTHWHWVLSRQPGVGWGTGIAFASYEIMASPVLFMAFFLATAPAIRPMSRRARIIFAVITGAVCAAAQLYADVAIGPYVALLGASLFTPLLDRWFRPRPLI